MRWIYSTLLFLCLPACCLAQADTVYQLPEATIMQHYLPATEHDFDSIDIAAAGHANLTQLLQTESSVFVRNYGPGTLGTLTIGGGSAEQTNVMWQGIAIRNPMLGQIDVTLLPVDLFTSIGIQAKGGSAQYGNNQLSGGLNLNTDLPIDREKTIGLSLEHGSWQRFSGHLKALYAVGQSRSQTSLYGLHSKNDYAFELNGLSMRQANASIQNLGLYHLSEIPLNTQNKLDIGLWWQDSEQEIPPTSVQNSSNANQNTTSFRSVLGWKNRAPRGKSEVRLGYVAGSIDYRNPARLEESQTRFGSVVFAAQHQWWFGGSKSLTLGVDDRLQHGDAPAYGGRQLENQLEVHAGYEWTKPRWEVGIFVRQGLLEQELMPTTASIQSSFQAHPSARISLGLSRDLRYPTLNERYWQPGGKPDIEEESGWSQRLSVSTSWQWGIWEWDMTGHGFNRLISNWILWSPQDELNFWAPDNLARVWSRGGGVRTQAKAQLADLCLSVRVNYSHTSSTNQVAIKTPRLNVGDQLFYTPKNRVGLTAETSWPKWRVRYEHQYTGSYPGILSEVPAFQVGSLHIARSFDWVDKKMRVWIRVHNLWDIQYRVIERRPMPGRNFRLGLSFEI